MTPTIAVIMTCHNRRPSTVAAIAHLRAQSVASSVRLPVFLTDDGSSDGTATAVLDRFDHVQILQGDGSLYWAAGMAKAEAAAMAHDPDYLLWLNDDTMMDPDALEVMLRISADTPAAIVVGATRDPESGAKTYGVRLRTSRWHPQRYAQLPVRDRIQVGDTFNGNLVLIPRNVRLTVGAIDGRFPHAYADDDYGLRASKLGVPIIQAPGSIATCSAERSAVVHRRGLSAWRDAQNPKGMPWRAQVRFLRRHGGPLWPLTFLGQQAKVVFR